MKPLIHVKEVDPKKGRRNLRVVKPCYHAGTSRVLETRRFEGIIYRLRECSECGNRAVSMEVPAPDGKFPVGLESGRKKKALRTPTWAELNITFQRDSQFQQKPQKKVSS